MIGGLADTWTERKTCLTYRGNQVQLLPCHTPTPTRTPHPTATMWAMLGPHCVDTILYCTLLAWHSKAWLGLKVDAENAGPSDCDGPYWMVLNCNGWHVHYHRRNVQSDLLLLESLSSLPLSPPLNVDLPSYHCDCLSTSFTWMCGHPPTRNSRQLIPCPLP